MSEMIGYTAKKVDNIKKDSPAVKSKSNTGHSPVQQILDLQRSIGNQAANRLLQSGLLQAKLEISQPGDIYEQEAGLVADRVMSMPERNCSEGSEARNECIQAMPLAHRITPFVQRQSSFPPDAEEKMSQEEKIQRKAEATSTVANPGMEQYLDSANNSGQPMPFAVRRDMEDRFGANFEHVRIHSDINTAQICRSLNAEAFTYQNNIYFGANKLNYSSLGGKKLLAHELTHTLQQQGIQCKFIQRRGGATAGVLGIHTNVVNAGLTAGHAWLSYTPTGGAMTTYGTWGNKTPIGLHRDLELAYPPLTSRTTNIDATDYTNLTSFASSNNAWGYINNCASFAARGWKAVTGEALSYTNFLGIPNPSSLGAGIMAANGGGVAGALVGPAATGGSSSSSTP